MQLRILLAFLVCLFGPTLLSAQTDPGVIRARPSLLTFRNFRLTTGLYANYNWDDSTDPDENITKTNTGTLPANFEFNYVNNQTKHYLAAGVLFDLGSPNSVIGFAVGGEYNRNRFALRNTVTDTTSSIQVTSLRIPAYLKIKIGDIHNRINGIIMGGAQYAIPLAYERLQRGKAVGTAQEVESGLYLSALVGLQYRTGRGEGEDTSERLRYWVFARADLATGNQFSVQGNRAVFGSANGTGFTYEDLNLSVGVAIFLGAGG